MEKLDGLIHLWDDVLEWPYCYTGDITAVEDIPDITKELLERLQIPYNFEKHPYTWNGVLHLGNLPTADCIIHEICHYLVSTEIRRKVVDYGLGENPYDRRDYVPLIDNVCSGLEDLAVCVLEYFTNIDLGLPNDTLKDRDQYLSDVIDEIPGIVEKLIEYNLLTKDLTPTYTKNCKDNLYTNESR